MTSTRRLRTVIGLAALAVTAVAVIPPSVPGAPSVSAADGPGAGGEYHTVDETRTLDTRQSTPKEGVNDSIVGPLTTGQAINVKVLGLGGVPDDPDEVLAVGLNVTITRTDVSGYVEVFPTGFRAAENQASLINFKAGSDVSNMAIVGVGNDGSITVLPLAYQLPHGNVDVLIDVFGWVSKTGYVDVDDSGSRLIPLDDPPRVLDQRPIAQSVGPGETVAVKIRGAVGIPNSENVTGVVINLTVDNSQPSLVHENTFVSARSAAPVGSPATSTTNVRKGLIKANLAFVPVGPDGNIYFYNSAGHAQLIVDVFGYLEKGRDAATYLGRIIPLEFVFRGFDTRQAFWAATPLGFGEQEDWSFWCFGDSVTVNSQQVNRQIALLGNVTGTDFDRIRPDLPNDTFLTLRPRDPAAQVPPRTSNVNVYPATPVPNMALLTYGDSEPLADYGNAIDPYMIRAYNHNGTLHYILDVFAIVLSDDPAPPIPAPTDPAAEMDYCGNPITT